MDIYNKLNRAVLTMCCHWRSELHLLHSYKILHLESIRIALQVTEENAPISILFHIMPKEIVFDFNRNS